MNGSRPTPQSATHSRRRTGRIARLPKANRDVVNRMIQDGVPYPEIIDSLVKLGRGRRLNYHHLASWRKGGYPDWLEEQDRARLVPSSERFGAQFRAVTSGFERDFESGYARLCAVMRGFERFGLVPSSGMACGTWAFSFRMLGVRCFCGCSSRAGGRRTNRIKVNQG